MKSFARGVRISVVPRFVLGLIVSLTAPAQIPTITLNGAGAGRVFEGLGGVSAGASSRLLIDYPEPYRSQILDYLFKPNYGASLQHLKVEIGGDVNSTEGSEPSHMHSATDQNYGRGYEWWLMQQAKLRNPTITLEALEWGAPGWIGNGKFFSQDNIDYILNFIRGAKNNYGLTIDEVGIRNETDFDANWIISLKAALQQAGLSTRVIAADQASAEIVNQMVANSALMSAVDIVGIHYPRGDRGPIVQLPGSKSIWASEEGAWRGDWVGASYLARVYNGNYISTKITLSEIWNPVTSYYDVFLFPGSGMMYANTPWSGAYNVQPAIWATAHTTQFAQPGWHYVDSSSGRFGGGGSYVTLKNGSDYSFIAETTQEGNNETVAFNIAGGLSTGPVHVWKTDANVQFVQQSDIIPVNGSFTFTFLAGSIYSLTTTTGQSKGSAVSPPPSSFPFPYADTFESYTPAAEPKYFSAVNGSFEIANCAGGRSGLCLRQAAVGTPIPWHSIGVFEPLSVLGSSGWANYQVSADVLLEQAGTAKLVGRFGGEDANTGDVLAYQFYVDGNGNWTLRRNNYGLLSYGTVPFSLNTWHNLKLVFNNNQIQGAIDGVTITSITDNSYASGYVGLGTQTWTNAQFDNFHIDLLPGSSPVIPQYQMSPTATSQTAGYEVYNAIDGYPNTFWSSAYTCEGGCRPMAPLPQSLTLALGGSFNVAKLRYLPRQDNNLAGTITAYNVYVSSDGVNFTPVATGNWALNATEKSVSFTPTDGSYVRLEAVQGLAGYATAAEINVEFTSSNGNPTPTISSLTPGSAAPGSPGFTLTVSGGNFVNGSTVRWQGSDRSTSFSSSTLLTADVPASDLTTAGPASVTVFNPTPGGGTSNSQAFSISAPSSSGGGGEGGNGTVGSGSAFVTAYTVTGRLLRNDFMGWVGLKLTAGSASMSVSAVGRVCVSGNSGAHIVKLVSASTGQDVAGGSAAVNMAGCTPGQFAYSALASAISLTPGASYYLVSQEAAGGDRWYDFGAVSTTSDAAVSNSVYSINSANWITINGANTSYVPTNMQYSLSVGASVTQYLLSTGVTGSGTITANPSSSTGLYNSGASVQLTATPASGYSFVNWSEDVSGSTNPQTVNMTAEHTVTANFQPVAPAPVTQYLLSTSVTGSGSIAANPSSSTGLYDSGTPVQLTATAASGYSFVNWSGDVSGSTNPQTVNMTAAHTVTANFQPVPSGGGETGGGSAGGAFVTGYSVNGRPVRNDFGGWVGMKLTVGTTALSVNAVGRVCVSGNSRTHVVKLVSAATGQDVAGGSAAVDMAGCTPAQFAYSALASAINLGAGASYYLVSQEAVGGDKWYDSGAVSTASDAGVNKSVYSVDSANWITINGANTSYVTPNMQYSLSGGAPVTQYLLSTAVTGSGTITANPSSSTGLYDSGTPVQLTATAASGYSFVNWSGDVSGSTNPQTVNMTAAHTVTANFQPVPSGVSGGTGTAFVTGYSVNGRAVRNDFGGWVGMKVTVGAAVLSVNSVGRICAPGNSKTHAVKLVSAATRLDVAGGSATVNMAGCTPGQFVYTALGGAINLTAGTSYYLVSQEVAGGDQWYDIAGVSTTADAAVNNSVYSNGLSWITISSANTSYVPPNLQYSK